MRYGGIEILSSLLFPVYRPRKIIFDYIFGTVEGRGGRENRISELSRSSHLNGF